MEKQVFEQQLDEWLCEWYSQFQTLRLQAAGAGPDIQGKLQREIDALAARELMLRRQFNDIKSIGTARWDVVEGGLSLARDQIAEALQELAGKLSVVVN